jgi:hypothetical protein
MAMAASGMVPAPSPQMAANVLATGTPRRSPSRATASANPTVRKAYSGGLTAPCLSAPKTAMCGVGWRKTVSAWNRAASWSATQAYCSRQAGKGTFPAWSFNPYISSPKSGLIPCVSRSKCRTVASMDRPG